MKRGLAMVAATAAGTFSVAVANGYAMDDAQVLANPRLQTFATLPSALTSGWWSSTASLYRPLTLVTLGAERLIAGPWLSHSINVVLHAAIAVMVTLLCRRFVSATAAVVAGLFFATLPAHAEAVSSVVGRAELLCAAFLVAAILVVTRPESPTAKSRALVALFSALALASKEVGVAAPVLVLAAAWAVPSQRPHARAWTLAAAAGTVALLLARFAALGTPGGDLAHPAFRTTSAVARIELALAMLPRALAMLLLPIAPTIDYSPPVATVLHPPVLPAVIGGCVVIAVVAGVVKHVHTPGAVTLGAVIAAATLLPTSNLVFASGVVSSGRQLYSPSIGAALVVGALVMAIDRVPWAQVRTAAYAMVGLLIVSAVMVSIREARVWRNTAAVLATAAVRQPDDYRVSMFAAYQARDEGQDRAAVALFGDAFALFPLNSEMNTDAATVALRVHDTTTAMAWLRAALEARPQAVRARTRLADVLEARGDTVGYRTLLEQGLALDSTQTVWRAALKRGR